MKIIDSMIYILSQLEQILKLILTVVIGASESLIGCRH